MSNPTQLLAIYAPFRLPCPTSSYLATRGAIIRLPLSIVDPELLDLVEQRAVADLQDLRRVGAIPSGGLESSTDELLLEDAGGLLDRQLAGREWRALAGDRSADLVL